MSQIKSNPCKHCGSIYHPSFKCFYKPRADSKPCQWCESKDHLSWQCLKNPKREKQMRRKIKRGKQNIKWMVVRNRWFKQNPPNHEGYYQCYICDRMIPAPEITLDHVKPRSGSPDLRYNMSNIKPCCSSCNTSKGSRSLENYLNSRNGTITS